MIAVWFYLNDFPHRVSTLWVSRLPARKTILDVFLQDDWQGFLGPIQFVAWEVHSEKWLRCNRKYKAQARYRELV